jgi:putative ABC transport system permease protein
VEAGPSYIAAAIAWIIVGVAALSTLASAVIALSLSRIDGRRDEYTLISIGAKPRTQRLIAFWQALVVAGLGCVIGGALALVPALAFANTILFAPPWGALTTSVLRVPVVIAVVALALRRSPRTVSPDRSLVG